MKSNKKSRQEAEINQNSGSSVERSLIDGLGHAENIEMEYGSPKRKGQSRSPKKIFLNKLKNQTMQDEEIMAMKKSMQKIAMKNRVAEFLEVTYKRNKDTVVSAKKNDSTKQVLKHADQMIKHAAAGTVASHDSLFDFGKKKTKVPLDSFTEYYAYKTEEKENDLRVKRKMLIETGVG